MHVLLSGWLHLLVLPLCCLVPTPQLGVEDNEKDPCQHITGDEPAFQYLLDAQFSDSSSPIDRSYDKITV